MRSVSLYLVLFFLCMSCQDDLLVEPHRYTDIPKSGSMTEKYLDSLYIYTNEIWLWNDYLPSYKNANIRTYANANSPLKAYQNALINYLGGVINPKDNCPFEKKLSNGQLKYSHLSESVKYGSRAELSVQGYGNGFGFDIGKLSYNDIRVAYVNSGSSAEKAGLLRGDQLLKINGIEVTNFDFAKEKLNEHQLKLTLQRQDGKLYQTEVYKSTYRSDAIYKHKILDVSGTKIGYLAYARFSNTDITKAKLDAIFKTYAENNIETLVVDLRYNGGGFVSSTRYLANLIAPNSLNGKAMYSEHYNKMMRERRATIFVDFSVANNSYNFEKSGSLKGIKKLYFIVSGNTASASEMLINIFKPYLNVRIVGTQTYGKPIGFFGLKFDDYNLFISSFLIKNSKNQCDYFDGFIPDIFAIDDLTYDFGDIKEDCLSKVVQDITGNHIRLRSSTFRNISNTLYIQQENVLIQDKFRLLP